MGDDHVHEINEPIGVVSHRIRWLERLMVFAFLLLAARLIDLQVLRQGEFQRRVRENVVRTTTIPAPRGTIRDAQGQVLAADQAVSDSGSGVEHPRMTRNYPLGQAAAHLVGYVDGDMVGRYGLERTLQNELGGQPGWEKAAVDARGCPMSEAMQLRWIDGQRTQAPRPGHDVTLTIDASLQSSIERLLRQFHGAGAVVVDVSTGGILALVSSPGFEPMSMAGGLTSAELETLLEDPGDPFFNRPLMGYYAPGAALDVFAVHAALREGGGVRRDRERCLGKRGCPRAHGVMDLRQALVHSCDDFFEALFERPGMTNAISWEASQFGLGEPLGLEQIHQAQSPPRGSNGVDPATVLQMAMAYGALAKGGALLYPQVVERVESTDGRLLRELEPRVRRHLDLSPVHRDLIVEAMVDAFEQILEQVDEELPLDMEVAAVADVGQPLHGALSQDVEPPGLSRDLQRRRTAWCAGFAPVDAPQIAWATVIEQGIQDRANPVHVTLEIVRSAQLSLESHSENVPSGSKQ